MKTKPIAWAALILVAILVNGTSVVVIERADRAAHAWTARVQSQLVEVGAKTLVNTIVGKLVCIARI